MRPHSRGSRRAPLRGVAAEDARLHLGLRSGTPVVGGLVGRRLAGLLNRVAKSLVMASLGCCLSTTLLASAENPRPQELLAHMAEVYAGCRSYRDAGTVKMVPGTNMPVPIEEQIFRTAFVRPDRFRFEFENAVHRARNIVWRNGSEVRAWWAFSWYPESPESIGDAIAGATGISSGAAHTVPQLLMPDEVSGWKLTELTRVSLLPDAQLAGHACFRVQGDHDGYAVTISLDQTTYLILRIEEELPARFGAVQCTSYEPAIGEDFAVPPFDPPYRGGARLVVPVAAVAAVLLGGGLVLLIRRRRRRVLAAVGPGPDESTSVSKQGPAQ